MTHWTAAYDLYAVERRLFLSTGGTIAEAFKP